MLIDMKNRSYKFNMSCKINWTEYNLSIPAWSNGRVGFRVQFPAMLYICVSLDILKSTLGSRLPGSIPGYPHVYNFFNSCQSARPASTPAWSNGSYFPCQLTFSVRKNLTMTFLKAIGIEPKTGPQSQSSAL